MTAPSAPTRDPRVDPRAGDVLRIDVPNRDVVTVQAVQGRSVWFSVGADGTKWMRNVHIDIWATIITDGSEVVTLAGEAAD